MLDSAIRVNKKHYPQTLLEECKYKIKKNETKKNFTDDLSLSSSDQYDNEPEVIILKIKSNTAIEILENTIDHLKKLKYESYDIHRL